MTAAGWLPAALNRGWTYCDRVPAGQAGISASAFYALRHRHSDAAVWRQRLAAGEITCNGALLGRDAALAAGDRLAWRRPPWLEPAVPAAWEVVHDDGDLLVLDKPSGLPVLPAGGWLEHTVLRLLEQRHRHDPAGVPRPVHRLGRFTSGLLVCARRAGTRAWLSAALRESTSAEPPEPARAADAAPQQPPPAQTAGQQAPQPPDGDRHGSAMAMPLRSAAERAGSNDGPAAGMGTGAARPALRKLYRALLVPGALALAPGACVTVTTAIGRRPHARLGRIWCAAPDGRPGDLPAHSVVTLLACGPEGDLVQVAIGSGRPHQIRIHCAALGAPLLGDPLYRPGGGADPAALPGDGGYRLQAWRLELRRPDGEPLVLQVRRALGEASRRAPTAADRLG